MNNFLTKLSNFKERYDYPVDKAEYMAEDKSTYKRNNPVIDKKYIKDGLESIGTTAVIGGVFGGFGTKEGAPIPWKRMGVGAGIGAGLGALMGFHDIKERYNNSRVPVETRNSKTEADWQRNLGYIHEDEDYYAKWRPKHPTEAKMTEEQARAHYQSTPEKARWSELDRHAMESQEYHTGDVEDDYNQRYFHKDYARPHVATMIIAKHGDPHDYYGTMHYEHGDAHPDIAAALDKLNNVKNAAEHIYATLPVKSASLILAAYDATDNLEAKLAFELVGRRLIKEAGLGLMAATLGKKAVGKTVSTAGLVGVGASFRSVNSSSIPKLEEGGAQ